MTVSHELVEPSIFAEDPPPWAVELFSERQREALTFTKLWAKSVAASSLPTATKAVAFALALYFSGSEHQVANPSVQRLADDTTLHRSTVIRHLDRLEVAGLIDRRRSPGRVSTSYRLAVPKKLPRRAQPSHRTTVAQDDGPPVDNGAEDPGPADQPSHSGSQLSHSEPQPSSCVSPTVAQDDPKGLEGEVEGSVEGGSSIEEPGDGSADHVSDQDQDQHQYDEPGPSPSSDAKRDRYYESGRRYRTLVDDGQLSDDQVLEQARALATAQRARFLEGYRTPERVPA
ncbi:MAG: winged helix-turn-helix transcriptional regulator [Nitriliruptoraceae bacterium]|nr:winged helix-turn-helix transcriptional regulator [Nitriliruptoraceae bacterium]